MSEKRFEVGFDEKRIFDIYAVNKNTTEYDIHKSCDLINSLYEENEQLKKENEELEISMKLFEDDVKRLTEEISYWKHRVSSLLMILSQFDNEKVKKLLEELESEKRFELAYERIQEINKNDEIIDVLTDDEVVDILNNQRNAILRYGYELNELKKENEQLKQQLDKIPKNIREVWK